MSKGQLQQSSHNTQTPDEFREVRDRENNLLCRYAPASQLLEIRTRAHGRTIQRTVDLSQFHNNSPPLAPAT